jgi:hypothetical protein
MRTSAPALGVFPEQQQSPPAGASRFQDDRPEMAGYVGVGSGCVYAQQR